MKRIERRVIAVNIFGVTGYTLLMTIWALFAGLIVLSLFQIPPLSPEQMTDGSSPIAAGNAESSEFLAVVSYLFAVLLAIVTVGILLTLPYFLAKWSARTLRWAMTKFKIETSRRHLFLAKGILTTLPLIGFLAFSTVQEFANLFFSTVYMATVGLSVIAIGLFLVQLLLARHLHIPADKTW